MSNARIVNKRKKDHKKRKDKKRHRSTIVNNHSSTGVISSVLGLFGIAATTSADHNNGVDPYHKGAKCTPIRVPNIKSGAEEEAALCVYESLLEVVDPDGGAVSKPAQPALDNGLNDCVQKYAKPSDAKDMKYDSDCVDGSVPCGSYSVAQVVRNEQHCKQDGFQGFKVAQNLSTCALLAANAAIDTTMSSQKQLALACAAKHPQSPSADNGGHGALFWTVVTGLGLVGLWGCYQWRKRKQQLAAGYSAIGQPDHETTKLELGTAAAKTNPFGTAPK